MQNGAPGACDACCCMRYQPGSAGPHPASMLDVRHVPPTLQGKVQVVPLCSSLGPLGSKDGACFASVQGKPLTYNAESLLLAGVATCPSATDCSCGGVAAGTQLPRQALPYFHRPCGAASLPAGTLPKCVSVTATGRQRLSSCLVEAANQLRCYSEVTVGGGNYWVLDHVCSEPLASSLAPAGAAPECAGPVAAAVMAAAAPVTAVGVAATLTPPRKRRQRPATGAAPCPTHSNVVGLHLLGSSHLSPPPFNSRVLSLYLAVQVRLVGGTPNVSGRLELNVGGTWGTVSLDCLLLAHWPTCRTACSWSGTNCPWLQVCDKSFTDREADTICRQLGLRTPGVAVGGAFYGQGSGRVRSWAPMHGVWLPGLRCVAGVQVAHITLHPYWLELRLA